MLNWTANFINDPKNDYKLIVEILYNDEEVGLIKQGQSGLELILFAHNKDKTIPFDWFLGLMEEANKSLSSKHK
jgi:hypothetical protein